MQELPSLDILLLMLLIVDPSGPVPRRLRRCMTSEQEYIGTLWLASLVGVFGRVLVIDVEVLMFRLTCLVAVDAD